MKQVYSEKRKAIDRVGVCFSFLFPPFIQASTDNGVLQKEEQRANGEVRTAKSKLHSLQQEANDDLPAGMAGYEAAKEVSRFNDLNREKLADSEVST